MTRTDVQQTLHEIADATHVPVPPDEVAFRRLVNAERRRHRIVRIVVASAAAVAVAAVSATGVRLALLPGEHEAAPAGPVQSSGRLLDEPAYLVRDGDLMAIDPYGTVHDLGLSAEGVVGFTAEGVLAVDEDSRLVWFRSDSGSEGPEGSWSFERGMPAGIAAAVGPGAMPTGAVQSAALSADGRWLAWQDLDNDVVRLDLKSGEQVSLTDWSENATGTVDEIARNSVLVDVGAAGALVSEDGDLVLERVGGQVPVPTEADGYGLTSDLRGELVAVGDRDDATRLYDVSSGTASRVATVDGTGELSPLGDALATVRTARDGSGTVWLWTRSGETRLTGLTGTPQTLAWADDETVLVVAAEGPTATLWACEVADHGCDRLPLSGSDLTVD